MKKIILHFRLIFSHKAFPDVLAITGYMYDLYMRV